MEALHACMYVPCALISRSLAALARAQALAAALAAQTQTPRAAAAARVRAAPTAPPAAVHSAPRDRSIFVDSEGLVRVRMLCITR
jgi:hypothetical protein